MQEFVARQLAIASRDEAERELARIGADPGGIARMADKMLSRCIRLQHLQCRQANIIKQEMLSLGGDAAVARGTVACSIEQTDCILIGTDKQLHNLGHRLACQPFGLAQIGSCLLALLDGRHALREWKTARCSLPLDRPLIMGILNVTPDSFSDGGLHHDCDDAVDHALQMIDEGADIIDIGGESTRPGAAAVPADLELARVMPVIKKLVRLRDRIVISIDTWKSDVAEAALDAGAGIINDISGLTFDSAMAGVASRSRAGLVVMHTRGRPESMQQNTRYEDTLEAVAEGLRHSCTLALEAGVMRESIAIDPGIGFGKDAAGNIELLRRLRELTSPGFPLLIGTSRKSFIGKILGREPDQRLFGTAATVALAVWNGAAILRVHDVRAMRDAALTAHAVMTGTGTDGPVT